MQKLTLGLAMDGLKKMGSKLGNEPKFKRHLQELNELETMAGEPLLIMVMGEFSAGKSTFINAILGQEVTVRGATPTTAVITKICYGDRDETVVHFKDGRIKQYDHNNFMRLTAETAADDEARRLREEMDYVEKKLNLSILKDVSIIDSPGLGAITAGHEQTTKRFMGNADAVVWLMNVQQPAKASEVNRLEALDPRLKPFVLVNQIDLIDEEEDDIDDILDDVRQKVKGHAHSVHGISALKALEGRLSSNNSDVEDSNIDEFFNLLRDEVLPHRDEYRMHTLVHETATLLRHGGETLKFWSEQIESLRNFNYEKYANEQATLQFFEQALAEFARLWKEYVYDRGQEAERQYFEGVLYQYGLLAPIDTKKALECFKVAAKYGESEAETAYASALESEGYYKEAFNEYQKAALQENGEAAAGLARLIEQGHGKGDAQKWYRKAAQWGFMEAHLHIDYGNDTTKKFNGLHEAALQGIPNAQVALAECYGQGIGCVRDMTDVFKWQLEAAKQGLKSQFVPVAKAYRNGVGVDKDSVQEFYWLTRAADYGDAESALDVARCLFYGHGVEKNRVEAFIRLTKLSSDSLFKAVNSQARKELQKLFEQGSPEDQILIGDAALNGGLQELFKDKNIFAAARWYERAESKGSLDGSYRKGLCMWRIYQESKKELKTLYDSYVALKNAAQGGHSEAEKFLREYFEEGPSELKYRIAQAIETNGGDSKDAFDWYLKAAEGGYAPSFTAVGELYANGKGCKKSWSNARAWLSKAKKEDGERGKESYKAFMAPTYRRIKRGVSAAAILMFISGLYMGHDFLLAQPSVYKIVYGNKIKTELSLGRLELGDKIDKMHEILGKETSQRQDGDFEFYIYPNVEVIVRNGRIETLISKDDTVATKQGIRSGMTYADVVNTYGKPTFVSDVDGLQLCEYKFDGFDERYGLLRFAINPETQLIDYISIRIPKEETERVQKEAEKKRLAAERAEKEKKAREEQERNKRKDSNISDAKIGGIKLGDRIGRVEQVLGKPIKKMKKEGNLYRYEYKQMDVAYDNGVVVGIAADNEYSSLTGRGVRAGSRLDEVLYNYGKNYTLSTYDDLDLYEYTFNDKNNTYILRFAVRKNEDRVKYISVRYVN